MAWTRIQIVQFWPPFFFALHCTPGDWANGSAPGDWAKEALRGTRQRKNRVRTGLASRMDNERPVKELTFMVNSRKDHVPWTPYKAKIQNYLQMCFEVWGSARPMDIILENLPK